MKLVNNACCIEAIIFDKDKEGVILTDPSKVKVESR